MKNKIKITSAVKYGGISLIIMAVVLAAVITVNLIVGSLPPKLVYITDDSSDIYKISDESRNFFSTLDEEITLYIVAREDASSEHHLMISEYVEKCALLSDNITVKYVDPILRPGFLNGHGAEEYTEEALSTDYTHLVIESDKRSILIPYGKLITTVYTGDELDRFYYANGYIPYSFNVEGCLISGIDYVTLERIPVMYYTTGHGENPIDSYFNYILSMKSVVYKPLEAGSASKVPDDAEALFIFSPTSDFTESETAMLEDFSKRGGNIILVSKYNSALQKRNLVNLYSFMEREYGLIFKDVKVFEGKSGSFAPGSNDQIYPVPSGVFEDLLKETFVLFRGCHAIEVSSDLPEGVTVNVLFSTSDKGYAKTIVDKNTVMEKTENDLEGKFILGAEATKKSASGGESKAYWFSSSDAVNIDGTYPRIENNTQVYYANIFIPVYIVSEALSNIEPVSLQGILFDGESLDISDTAANIWSIILIGIVPIAVMAYGMYVVHVRKRR